MNHHSFIRVPCSLGSWIQVTPQTPKLRRREVQRLCCCKSFWWHVAGMLPSHLKNEKRAPWLFLRVYVGDEVILPSFIGLVIDHFKDSYCRAFFVAHFMLESRVFTLLLVMYGGLAGRICEKIPRRCTFFRSF